MATIDIGKIKQVWRGTYAGGTAYTPDDVVEYTDSGILSSYICIANTTGNAPSSSGTAHGSWNYLAKGGAAGANGSNGTDVGATLANKEIAFKTNAGAVDGIPIGSAGEFLKVNSGATGYEFGAVSSDWVKVASNQLAHTPSYSTDAFSATYNTYKVFMSDIKITSSNGNSTGFRARNSGGDLVGSDYYIAGHYNYTNSGGGNTNRQGQWAVNQSDMSGWYIPDGNTKSGYGVFNYEWTFFNMNSGNYKSVICRWGGWERSNDKIVDAQIHLVVNTTSALTGFTFNHLGNQNFSTHGKVKIYGLKE